MKLVIIPAIFVGFFTIYFVFVGLSTIPGLLLRREKKTISLDGVTTIQDAVQKSRSTGLSSWDLVEFAQKLTARKFTYSRRNSWESPEKAFARGMGYCYQQARALQAIYKGLGIQSTIVYGKGYFPESTIHGVKEPAGIQNHAWLEVKINSESRFVCSGHVANSPGNNHFTIATPVREMGVVLRFFTYTGAIIVNAARDFRSTRFQRDISASRAKEPRNGKANKN